MPSWLLSDFYAWLWAISEHGGDHELADGTGSLIVIDDQISFKGRDGGNRSAFKGEILADARRSFSLGMQIDQMTVDITRLEEPDLKYQFKLGSGGLQSYKALLPLSTGHEDVAAGVWENLELLERADRILEGLFLQFLDMRVNRQDDLRKKIAVLIVDAGIPAVGSGA